MKTLDFQNNSEFVAHITKVLKIKPTRIESYCMYVRKHNTLVRIQKYLNTVNLVAKNSNKYRDIYKTDSHYFLDIWVGNNLFTFRCYIKNKEL